MRQARQGLQSTDRARELDERAQRAILLRERRNCRLRWNSCGMTKASQRRRQSF